jgi:hypothetical protein
MSLRYQQGYLRCVKRKTGSSQWEFLWRENVEGRRIRRTAVIGSIDEYPTEESAQAALNGFRMRLNENRSRQGQRVILVADLIDHYIETELSDETEWHAQSTRLIHTDFLKRWVRPHWGMVNIRDVRTVAVEAWLRQLRRRDCERALANATKAKIRNVMSVIFKLKKKINYPEALGHLETFLEKAKGRSKFAPVVKEAEACLRELEERMR